MMQPRPSGRDRTGVTHTGQVIVVGSAHLGALSFALLFGLSSCDRGVTDPEIGDDGTWTAPVDSSGGTLIFANGRVQLDVPPGALSDNVTISVTEVRGIPDASWILPGTAYTFSAGGLTFGAAATLTIAYEPGQTDEPERLAVFRIDGSNSDWLPTIAIDPITGSVSAAVTHFSTLAIGEIQPTVRTCDTDGSPWRWPVCGGQRTSLGQAYGQFLPWANRNQVRHHHTGLDIGPAGREVVAIADGKVVARCRDKPSMECDDFVLSPSPSNHGLDGVVILEHQWRGEPIYALYAHMQGESVMRYTPPAGSTVEAGRVMGVMNDKNHVHLEVKREAVLHNPIRLEDSCVNPSQSGPWDWVSTCWGYVRRHPDAHGFFDPLLFLHDVEPVNGAPWEVTEHGTDALLRVGPGSYGPVLDLSGGPMRVELGQQFHVEFVADSTIDPECGLGWVQVKGPDGTYFNDLRSLGGEETLPRAWLCKGQQVGWEWIRAVGGAIVEFPDPNLEAAVREAIGKPEGHIYEGDLTSLTVLWASFRNIADLTGIEYARALQELHIGANSVTDIAPLRSLTGLRELRAGENRIQDISPLATLESLEVLDLSNWSPGPPGTHNRVSDLSPLAGLRNLRVLALNSTGVSDLTPLASLNQLRRLDLMNGTTFDMPWNDIADLGPLVGLSKLESLSVVFTSLSDVTPLAGLTSLKNLWLGRNWISDIGPLSGLTNLETLLIGDNNIGDLSALSGLTELKVLSLGNGGHISAPSGNNHVSDLFPLIALTNLERLDLVANKVVNIEPLTLNAALGEGDVVQLVDNPLGPTALCRDIPALLDRGVTVTYHGDCDPFPLSVGRIWNYIYEVPGWDSSLVADTIVDARVVEGHTWFRACGTGIYGGIIYDDDECDLWAVLDGDVWVWPDEGVDHVPVAFLRQPFEPGNTWEDGDGVFTIRGVGEERWVQGQLYVEVIHVEYVEDDPEPYKVDFYVAGGVGIVEIVWWYRDLDSGEWNREESMALTSTAAVAAQPARPEGIWPSPHREEEAPVRAFRLRRR